MTLAIRMSNAAGRDRARLAAFLVEKNPAAALRAVDTIVRGIAAPSEYPMRGHRRPDGLRELMIPSGQSGYVAYYRVEGDQILIVRVFQMREDRP